jgi:hypothetical protein
LVEGNWGALAEWAVTESPGSAAKCLCPKRTAALESAAVGGDPPKPQARSGLH